jgi:hypothetical protein
VARHRPAKWCWRNAKINPTGRLPGVDLIGFAQYIRINVYSDNHMY